MNLYKFIQHLFKTPRQALWVRIVLFPREFNTPWKKGAGFIGIFLCFLFLLLGIATVSDYGINWDEPVHYIRGQAFLRFFLTGKKDNNDLPRIATHYAKLKGYEPPKNIEYADDKIFRRSIYQLDNQGTNYLSFNEFVSNPGSHPPINGELASVFNYIFYQKLGWMGDVESYHLFVIFVSFLLVLSVFLFVSEQYGFFAGLISFLSLILYPLFFSESHFNIKDPVEASFYGMTIIFFYNGIVRQKKKWIFLSSLTAGIALGTKFNIFFIFPTLLTWLIVLKWEQFRNLKRPFDKGITLVLILFLILPFFILFIFYPNLWSDPINKFILMLSFYRDIGTITYQPPQYLFLGFINTYALKWVLFITPLVVLFFSCFGIIYSLKHSIHEKNKTSLLVLLWFVIPILRVSVFHTGIYGGVRQIMEFIPAMAILSGIGAGYMVRKLHGYIVKNLKPFSHLTIKPFQLLIILSFIPIALKLISIHPNENVYMNPLIGGLRGAEKRNFADWGSTLGSAYRQGIIWINQYAEKEASLALVNGFSSNIPRIWIRKDIDFNESYYSSYSKKGEYLMEVTDYSFGVLTPKEKRLYIDNLLPVYQVKVDGVPILKIWKNS